MVPPDWKAIRAPSGDQIGRRCDPGSAADTATAGPPSRRRTKIWKRSPTSAA
jgi:hypothetical protein